MAEEYEHRPASGGPLPQSAGEWLTGRFGPVMTVSDQDIVVSCVGCGAKEPLSSSFPEIDADRVLYVCSKCGEPLVRIWAVDETTYGYRRFGPTQALMRWDTGEGAFQIDWK